MNSGKTRARLIWTSLLAAGIYTVLPGSVLQCWVQVGGITGVQGSFSSAVASYFIDCCRYPFLRVSFYINLPSTLTRNKADFEDIPGLDLVTYTLARPRAG